MAPRAKGVDIGVGRAQGAYICWCSPRGGAGQGLTTFGQAALNSNAAALWKCGEAEFTYDTLTDWLTDGGSRVMGVVRMTHRVAHFRVVHERRHEVQSLVDAGLVKQRLPCPLVQQALPLRGLARVEDAHH
jgi:hypothetical protein